MRTSVVLVYLAVAFLTGCEASSTSKLGKPNTLDSILDTKTVRVGYIEFDPCVIKDDATNELSGVFVDMVEQVVRPMGIKVTWVETSLANFSAGLKSRQFDFCVGPTFITPSRATAVTFSEPISYFGNSAVVKADSSFKPKAEKDLDRDGLRIAVLQGQVMEEYCKTFFPKATVVTLSGSDLTAPLLAVSSGQADVGLTNTVMVMRYSKAHPEVEAVLLEGNQIEILPLAWTTRFEDQRLRDFLNASIIYLKSTGRLADYHEKYQSPLLYDQSPGKRMPP